jgi:hypothetical protein
MVIPVAGGDVPRMKLGATPPEGNAAPQCHLVARRMVPCVTGRDVGLTYFFIVHPLPREPERPRDERRST